MQANTFPPLRCRPDLTEKQCLDECALKEMCSYAYVEKVSTCISPQRDIGTCIHQTWIIGFTGGGWTGVLELIFACMHVCMCACIACVYVCISLPHRDQHAQLSHAQSSALVVTCATFSLIPHPCTKDGCHLYFDCVYSRWPLNNGTTYYKEGSLLINDPPANPANPNSSYNQPFA